MCSNCILDTIDDPDIQFDNKGICNYCNEYYRLHTGSENQKPESKKEKLSAIISKMKAAGRDKPYDCILGISGGIDSCYLAYKAKQLGLRALIVHYDNGWNSALAVNNIEKIINKLNFDLFTYVNDWSEFKDIQLSFLKASVIDIELITDHGILSVLYKAAKKNKCKYILLGSNSATESILPSQWYHWKNDALNIKAIHKHFGTIKIKTFPYINFYNRIKIDVLKKIRFVSILDLMDYNKEEAKKELISLGWKDYGGKHFESIFTRFYQGYILPVKFKVDKRKAHLSSIILAGQIDRVTALKIMENNEYTQKLQFEDKEFVIKKLGIGLEEFEKIMTLPIKSHFDYPSYITRHYKYMSFLTKLFRPLKRK
ncbi:MAG: N-acetyl sugar amidotransferase [Bacteroidetes bacterium]|nr:N-acetyl sugar amidotransferase [Bacteroidota bacterium]